MGRNSGATQREGEAPFSSEGQGEEKPEEVLDMRTITRSEMEKLPKCLYQPFIPCSSEQTLNPAHCLACSLSGLQDALVRENLAGATLCLDGCLLILKDMGIVLKL